MIDYDAAKFWEARADHIVSASDHPERFRDRGWYDDQLERDLVPALLREHAKSVLVVGCGAGRQYQFLQPLGIEICGFDVAPALVAVCRDRYPHIQTVWDDVTQPRGGPYPHEWRADAVCCTTVLQHVPPDRIDAAVANVARFARKLIVLREMVWRDGESDYQWARDYRPLFPDWLVTFRCVTDESDEHRTELMVLAK